MSNPRKKPPETGTWGQFFRFILKAKIFWPLVIVDLLLNLWYSDIMALIPRVTGELYAGNFESSVLYKLIGYAFAMAAVNMVAVVVSTIGKVVSTKNTRNVLWKKMMRMEASSETAQSADTLLSAITIDTQNAVSYFIDIFVGIPATIYLLVDVYAIANELNPKLMWAMLALIPLYVAYAIILGYWQEKANYRVQMRVGRFTGFLSERIRNLNIIKAYTNEGLEEQNGLKAAQELYQAKLKPVYIDTAISAYTTAAYLLCELFSIIWASHLLKNGEITVDAWMTFFAMVMLVSNQLLSLAQIWPNFKLMKGYAVRVARIMDAPDERDGDQAANLSGDIAFSGVTYRYDDSKAALDNVSFTIPQGKMTAIVGPSGSGKSTALNLIERIYTPASGKVTVGGKDVSNMRMADYRTKLAYVQQDTGMFSGTIREAMTYGIGRAVSQSELESAAATSGILADIQAIPGGFDGKVAAWGESLSGGQRQKLVVARELLRNAEVLLLDEPTSALDANTAVSIHSTLTDHFKGKTIVTVTHDLRLIGKADQIVVMDGGHVAGYGGHEALMKTCPLYRELVEEQSYQEVYQA